MEIDFDNIFIASIRFAMQEKTRLVFAQNKEDAIATIKDYYDEPEIGFIVSYEEINQLYHLATKKDVEDNKQFILVIEMIREESKNVFYEHYEWVKSLDEIKNKYFNRDCLFCDKEFIIGLSLESEKLLKEPQERPLISENISL